MRRLDTNDNASQAARVLSTSHSSPARPRGRKTVGSGFWLLVALTVAGCGPGDLAGRDVVTAVDVRGGDSETNTKLKEGIATRPDSALDPDVLAKDLERVRRYYQARGYHLAQVRAARIVEEAAHEVRIEIAVVPGSPTLVSDVELEGLAQHPVSVQKAARAALELEKGVPLDESTLHSDARALEKALADEGFAYVKVKESATVSLEKRSAAVRYEVDLGPPAVFGRITIEGLKSLPGPAVIRQLTFQRGDAFSRSAIERGKKRLLALGVFSSVEVKPDLSKRESGIVPIRVVAREGSVRSFYVGALVEVDSIRLLGGVRVGWEHRNFLGGLRKLTVSAAPGVLLYPMFTREVSPRLLPTVTSSLRLEQPDFIEARTTGFVEADGSVFPVVYSDFNPGDNIIGFGQVQGILGVERDFGGGQFTVRPSHNSQANFPFMYLGDKPEGLDTVYVLFPEIIARADFRDDAVEPHQGAYFELSAQAAGALLGDAKDVRLRPEMRLYAKLTQKWTLALRTTVGLLFPRRCRDDPTRGCYGDSLDDPVARSSVSDPATIRDQQTLLFRVLYSGGATSNRGYMLREVGPHGPLGFLVPSNTNCAVENPPDQCIQPLGGLTLWEASLEARWSISKLFGTVLFVDASDVTRQTFGFRATHPHLAAGTGLRLRTPVGAARLDVGVRIPYLQEVGQRHPDIDEGKPREIFRAPMAIHFGLGEAF